MNIQRTTANLARPLPARVSPQEETVQELTERVDSLELRVAELESKSQETVGQKLVSGLGGAMTGAATGLLVGVGLSIWVGPMTPAGNALAIFGPAAVGGVMGAGIGLS